MVKGKGRNPVKQYMPAKPIKRGSKLWCIGCSCCAYMWDFQLYAGKEDNAPEGGLSTSVVYDLCHPLLDNKHHVIYMDNFFSSVALCKKLKGFGTYSVGTLRANREKEVEKRRLSHCEWRGDNHHCVERYQRSIVYLQCAFLKGPRYSIKKKERWLCFSYPCATSSQRLQCQYGCHQQE